MKKTAIILAALGIAFALTACTSTEQKTAGNGKGSQQQSASKKELIPLKDMEIVANEEETYQGRPFKGVPVHVEDIKRYSDRVVIKTTFSGEYSKNQLGLTLVKKGKDTDLVQNEYLFVDGIVNKKADTGDVFPSNTAKAELTSAVQAEFLDMYDKPTSSKKINQTKSNDFVTLTVDKVDVGDKFVRVYITTKFKEKQSPFDTLDVTATADGQEIKETDDNLGAVASVALATLKNDQHVFTFDKFDISNGFSINIFYRDNMQEPKQIFSFGL